MENIFKRGLLGDPLYFCGTVNEEFPGHTRVRRVREIHGVVYTSTTELFMWNIALKTLLD